MIRSLFHNILPRKSDKGKNIGKYVNISISNEKQVNSFRKGELISTSLNLNVRKIFFGRNKVHQLHIAGKLYNSIGIATNYVRILPK